MNNTKHANALLLENLYSDLLNGNLNSFLSACADNITFQVAGKSKLSGKYTKADFAKNYVSKVEEMSGGKLKLEIHDILASDRHAVALTSSFVTRNGKDEQIRTAHVWRFENGKPVAWYEYPRDLYQYDTLWS